MTDTEAKSFFEQLFRDMPLDDFLRSNYEDEFRYGGHFQRLYGPNGMPPEQYGYSGEEI